MLTEINKAIVRRFLLDAVNTGNTEFVEEIIDPDYYEVYDGKKYKIGVEGVKNHIIGVRQTYPDLFITIENQIAEGDWVVTCITAKGTHKGVWLNIKPTGKQLVYTGVNVDRIVNGKIIEHGGAANLLLPLLEAGALQIVKYDENI